jgi:hypothetical protein
MRRAGLLAAGVVFELAAAGALIGAVGSRHHEASDDTGSIFIDVPNDFFEGYGALFWGLLFGALALAATGVGLLTSARRGKG